jgi:hydroxyacylglutathione hydrolase
MFFQDFKTTKRMGGVYEIEEFSSVKMWLVEGDDKCLLIDTGLGLTDLPAMIAGITDKPAVVVNTHIHIDHIGGNGQFPEVMCGRFDEPFAHVPLGDPEKQIIFDYFSEAKATGVRFQDWDASPAKRVIALKEGDVISLGGLDIEVCEIPGHTIGSIALLDRKHRVIFTGDSIFTGNGIFNATVGITNGPSAPLSVPSATVSVYLDSLKKLASLKDAYDYIAPSHADPDEPDFLEPGVVDIYIKGIEKILSAEPAANPSNAPDEKVKSVKFEVGGVTYDPNRL